MNKLVETTLRASDSMWTARTWFGDGWHFIWINVWWWVKRQQASRAGETGTWPSETGVDCGWKQFGIWQNPRSNVFAVSRLSCPTTFALCWIWNSIPTPSSALQSQERSLEFQGIRKQQFLFELEHISWQFKLQAWWLKGFWTWNWCKTSVSNGTSTGWPGRYIPEDDEQQDDERNNDDDAEYQDACEDDDDQPEDEGEDEADASPAEIIGNLASVLTVTSKKLQSTVLGRKFTGGNRSIEERKKTSSCTACGQVVHWAGDSCCPAGPKPGRKGAGKGDSKHGGGKGGAQRDQGGNNNKPKKTFVVSCPDQFSGEIDPDMLPSESATFYNFPARFVVGEQACTTSVTEVVDFAGYMILDTACQRSCFGRKWLDVHLKILKKFSLPIVQIEATDTFQFVSGEPETSSKRVHIPVAFEGQQSLGVVLGSSVLDVQIPFLASHTMMSKLGFVIDLTLSLQYCLNKLSCLIKLYFLPINTA